jgi:hypothetical protein
MSGVVEIDETCIGGNAIRRFKPEPKPAKEEMVVESDPRQTENARPDANRETEHCAEA